MTAIPEIDEARWGEVQERGLAEGAHSTPDSGMCAMEAVAYITGAPFSDHPECVCPVIAAFLRSWNDALPADERTALLLPLLPDVVGTRATRAVEERRSLMAGDWLVRTHTPAWLRLAGLTAQADMLAGLPEITSMAQVESIRPAIAEVRKDAAAAWKAARDAARKAAWAAASDAAWKAAVAAASDAAWKAAVAAAWAAASDAAWKAARNAARNAARDAGWTAAWAAASDAAVAAASDAAVAAAGKNLAPVKSELQQSAIALVRRMIAAGEQA